MGCDITQEFKTLVKKASKNASVDTSILRPIRHPDAFTRSAYDVSQHIQETKQLMKSQRNRYIIPGMTSDLERDRIEQEMVSFIKSCSANVEHLNGVIQKTKHELESEQAIAHRHGMVLIISEELKSLTLLLDQYRSEHATQMKTLQERRRRQQNKQQDRMKSQLPYQETTSSPNNLSRSAPSQEMIQEESKALFDELTIFSDRVFETEKMMVEISTLNQMLCSQILSQADQIEQVYTDAIQSSENMIRGNVHLTKAIKANSSTRKYVLVLMILAAFMLLFFDRFYS